MAIVEFAIVALVLFMLFFGLVDISIVEIGNSAATNAVRSGARVGILNPEGADVSGSAANTAIVNAVTGRLAGLVFNPVITVACLDGTTGTTVRVGGCTSSAASPIIPDRDLLRVTMTWTHRGISPFITKKTKTDSATMVIVGSGAVAVPPTDCKITAATVSPSYLSIGSAATSGPITSPTSFTITATTNGLCSTDTYAAFYTGTEAGSPAPATKVQMTLDATGTATATIAGSAYSWTLGEHGIRFTGLSTSPEITYSGLTTKVTVFSDGTCAILSAGVSPPTNNPPSVRIENTYEPSVLRTTAPADSITVLATTTAACPAQTVVLSYTPAAPGSERHDVPTSRSGTSYTWVIPLSVQWTTGLKTFTFDNNGGASVVGWLGAVATVQVNKAPPACTISVAFRDNATGATITSVNVDQKGPQALGRLATGTLVTVTQELGSGCVGPIYLQWDRGRGFASGFAPTPVAMTPFAVDPPYHTYVIPLGESLPPPLSGGNKIWATTGQVTFRFWNGNPNVGSGAVQLTPLTPSTLNLVSI